MQIIAVRSYNTSFALPGSNIDWHYTIAMKSSEVFSVQIFLSRPTWIAAEFEQGINTFLTQLDNLGLVPRTLGVSDYANKAPLDEVIEIMKSCHGAIVLGVPQIVINSGFLKDRPVESPITLGTEWNHLEAGLAYAAGLPMLVVHHQSVSRGIFDRGVMNAFLHCIDMSVNNWSMQPSLNGAIKHWRDSCASGKPSFDGLDIAVSGPKGRPICPHCSTTVHPRYLNPVPSPFDELIGGNWECKKCKYVE